MTELEPYLSGIRVLDFTQYLAGPSCTRLLAEMGADVIKVEIPPYGDPSRAIEPRRNRRSAFFVQQNRGKRSICVDIDRPEGLDVIRALVAHVDIVIENFSPGVMARKGLGSDDLAALNPRLIQVSVSGYGQSGPLRDRPAFDFVTQAYAGIMHMTGDPDGPPTFVGIGLADTNAGVHAFAAIGHALYHRERTGRGTVVDVSMVDSLLHMHETSIHAPGVTDGEYRPLRQGRHYQPMSPAGTFRGPDGWIVLLAGANQIGRLWAAIGRPELGDDPRFHNANARVEHRDDLTRIIEGWLATFATDAEALAVLHEHRVPCSPVLDPADLGDEPHLRERGSIVDIEDRLVGRMTIPGFPLRYSDAPPAEDLRAPDLGEHNAEVLAGLLGYDDEQVRSLEVAEVLFHKDR